MAKHDSIDLNELNIDMVFILAWAGFLQLDKITYINIELKKASFARPKIIRFDVSCAKSNQYVVLRLK